jgi:hypothetical protein
MGLQLSAPIATARGILNDPNATRYSQADLLQYANDALDHIVKVIPQLFYVYDDFTCVEGSLQSLSFDNSVALVDVKRVQNGNVVTRSDVSILDEFSPAWRSGPAGAAKHWMPFGDDPRRFLVYPPAPANQVLEVLRVAVPLEFGENADTWLPTQLSDAISDYIVYRAESRDDEYVNSNRAAQFFTSFVGKLKGA